MSSKRTTCVSVITVLSLLVGVGCGGAPESGTEEPVAETESNAQVDAAEVPIGSWRAVAIEGSAVSEGVEVTLALDADGRASGSNGCNRYTGAMTFTGASLEVGPLATTRMACPPPAMDVEAAFERAIAGVVRFERASGSLRLLGNDGAVLVDLVPMEDGADGV